MTEARRRLEHAEAGGFDALAQENARWFGALYEQRENGRVYYGGAGEEAGRGAASEDLAETFRS
jgi:hypothetical protein